MIVSCPNATIIAVTVLDMTTVRRTLVLATLTTCAAAVLSGCGGGTAESSAPEAASDSTSVAAKTTATSAPGSRIFAVADNPDLAADYLGYLKSINQNVADSDKAVHQAGEICTALDAGKPLTQVREEWVPVLTDNSVDYYIIGAITRYCPDHENVLN